MNLFSKLFVALRNIANHPLNQRSKTRAVLDFCLVQVAVRLVPGDICVPFPNGTKLLISPRMRGAAHFIAPGLCEFEDMSFVMHFLRPDELFIDLGANVGAYTVLASGSAGARTIAFEPSPSSFRYLVQNVRLNDLSDKVIPQNVAVGAEESVLNLTEGLGTENYISPAGASTATSRVNVTTLDKALAGLDPVLMKIDVEGFETNVVAGAKRVLAQSSLQALIIERAGNAARYGFDEAQLHREIQAMSFAPCAYLPLERSLCQIPSDTIGNIIYVRNLEVARRRVQEALPFEFAELKI